MSPASRLEPQPRVGTVTPPSGIDPLVVLATVLGALVVAAGGAVWLAGSIVEWNAGRGWHPPKFNVAFYTGLVNDQAAVDFPHVSLLPVWILSGIFGVVVLTLVLTIWLKVTGARRVPGDPLPSLATTADIARLTGPQLARNAARLRPSLAGRKPRDLAPADLGVPLGVKMRSVTELRSSFEDVIVAVMAPRSGKSTGLAVPPILDAPGAVIATSNKHDLFTVTSALRARVGTVWTFDPQQITYTPQTWWWNPLVGVRSVEDAQRLGQHFLSAKEDTTFWDDAALELLTALILAAASARGTLADVYTWLTDSASQQPVRALEAAGHTPTARAMRGAQNGAPETREGIYQTARTAARALREPRIMSWVTPPDGVDLPQFDPRQFPESRDTLYLLSKDGAGSAAPLVAALTDAVFRTATLVAGRRGGRLDPPLLAVLDEAANICRIKDLPSLYSHLGSRGIIPITILQSYKQGVLVWGEDGMAALWSAATVKLVGPGIDDAKFAEDLSRLVGDHDVQVQSTTRTKDGMSHNASLRRQRILGPEEIRALPIGSALLFATGARPALLHLRPWYADKTRGPQLERERVLAETQMEHRAQAEHVLDLRTFAAQGDDRPVSA